MTTTEITVFDFASCLVGTSTNSFVNHSTSNWHFVNLNHLVSLKGTKVQDPKTYNTMVGSVLDAVGMNQVDQSINVLSSNINDDKDCWLCLTYTENEKKDQNVCKSYIQTSVSTVNHTGQTV